MTVPGVGGKPSKYDPSYCAGIIAHMADGSSMTSYAAEVEVARSTLNEWIGSHPEFAAAVSIAKAKCAAWWEKVNRDIAKNGGGTGSAQACALGLKNMAADDWREKSEVDVNIKGELPDIIAAARARAASIDGE